MKIAFQMDPIEYVDIDADSTFRLAEEAQNRGHDLYVYTPDDLTFNRGKIAAKVRSISLKREIGELSRVTGWCRVFGMVNSTADFSEQHLVINGFSDFIVDVFGSAIGKHARSAIGVSGLPMNFAIEIEGELEIT